MKKKLTGFTPVKSSKAGIRKSKYLTGFTLIELLVVATIIAILAAVVLVNLNKAQAKSRDSQRKSDLTRIATAMDAYKVDVKKYVVTCTSTCTTAPVYGFVNADSTILSTLISGGYIASIPQDPTNDSTYKYEIKSNGQEYKLRVKSETIKPSGSGGDSATVAKNKAGDFYNSCTGCDQTFLQISTTSVALGWSS